MGDWDASADAAMQIVTKTLDDGTNPAYEALLKYYNCPSEELRWAATQVMECTVRYVSRSSAKERSGVFGEAPQFFGADGAASILMELSNVDPSRVPLEILIPLSSYKEDWYVQAPANAALKTMMSAMPNIYRIFRARLRSSYSEEREHAASALADIAAAEPWLLDADDLRVQIKWLRASNDEKTAGILAVALPQVSGTSRKPKYKYGL